MIQGFLLYKIIYMFYFFKKTSIRWSFFVYEILPPTLSSLSQAERKR